MEQTTTSLFKLQHPQDLVTRLFILEYIKDLGVTTVKEKLTEGEAHFWLYSFEGEGLETQYDFNWEYLLFKIPLPQISKIMERYIDQVEEIEAKRQAKYKAFRQEAIEMQQSADISLYDLAKADMESQKTKLD